VVIFKGPRFVPGHPDADQIAGEIVTLRQRMQSLACNVFLSDLTLEFDAVGVVLGHGFHPWKARRPRSIPNPRPVHRQGRTPIVSVEEHALTLSNTATPTWADWIIKRSDKSVSLWEKPQLAQTYTSKLPGALQ